MALSTAPKNFKPVIMVRSRGGSGKIKGPSGPLFQCLDFAALYGSFDSRHFQEQADGRPFAKDWSNVSHDLAIFAHMECGRNSSTSRLERSAYVHVAWKPGKNCLHRSEKFWAILPKIRA